jgi:putative chitinase
MRASEFTPRKLVIFDIDDTLVNTQTKVHVIKDGEVVTSLNSHDFTHYKLKPGESFDFEDFRNAREFFEKSRPIIPMMNQLKRDINTGNKVVMVTARADFDDKELFLDTFRKYGVDMDKVHVYRAGNLKGGSTEDRKKQIIDSLLSKGDYTKAIMYDDAKPNLHTFVELKKDHPKTKFYAWHVSLDGEANEYMREGMVSEKKRKKKKTRWAAYGPGPYGGYGYAVGYSGDGGIGGDSGGGESIKYEGLKEAGFLSFLKSEPAPKKKWDPAKDSRVVSSKKDDTAWIKLLLDKHRRGIPLTNREWNSIEQWKLKKAIAGESVDEGWKDALAGAALATGLAFGAPGDAEAAKKKPTNVIQQISKKDISKSVTGTPHEVFLKREAEKAGIKGQELAAFLAQCAHETLDFKHMKEIGGSLDFKKYDIKFAPRKAKALGNTKPGDGAKFKGRGYIQLTGKYNYKKAGEALGVDLLTKPELLEKPEIAAKAAVWYWKERVRDKVGNFKDTEAVTKPINPGMKHLDQRKDKHDKFMVAMK